MQTDRQAMCIRVAPHGPLVTHYMSLPIVIPPLLISPLMHSPYCTQHDGMSQEVIACNQTGQQAHI